MIKRINEDDHIHHEVVQQVDMSFKDFIDYRFVFFCSLASGTVARNKPLNRSACRPKWKSDVPITDNQLRRKREEYWDTGEIVLLESIRSNMHSF